MAVPDSLTDPVDRLAWQILVARNRQLLALLARDREAATVAAKLADRALELRALILENRL